MLWKDTSTCVSTTEIVKIAAFDFDGTCLNGNSPVMLVKHLVCKGMLDKSVIARILAWGIAYKLRLPQNEAWVRGLVFRAFEGKPVEDVDAFLKDFYDEVVEPRFRAKASQVMQDYVSQGVKVMLVSATFEPIAARAKELHPIDYQISTRMCATEHGTYTCQVEGIPVEGAQKLVELRAFANETWGEGNWRLVAAYGDHHSDRELLSAADEAYAVCPDRPLTRTAKENGWHIVEW